MQCAKDLEESVTGEDRPEKRKVGGVIGRPVVFDVSHLDDAHVEDHRNETFHFIFCHRSPVSIQSERGELRRCQFFLCVVVCV